MTTYTNVFGGANIYPSEVSYSSLTLTADVVLSWPEETSTNDNLATRIIDVTAASGGWSIYLPEPWLLTLMNQPLPSSEGEGSSKVPPAPPQTKNCERSASPAE